MGFGDLSKIVPGILILAVLFFWLDAKRVKKMGDRRFRDLLQILSVSSTFEEAQPRLKKYEAEMSDR
jgi:hypothetical protein